MKRTYSNAGRTRRKTFADGSTLTQSSSGYVISEGIPRTAPAKASLRETPPGQTAKGLIRVPINGIMMTFDVPNPRLDTYLKPSRKAREQTRPAKAQ